MTASDEEVAALRAEVAQLRAKLDQTSDGAPRPRQIGLRSTTAGHDVLFSAVEKARMPMILTDPRQPDDPIIFANRAFQDLTGYSSDELVGRNCRFLQGPDTDPAQVDLISKAVAEDRDFAAPIINHRRDGSTFVNDLFISSIFDEDGQLFYRFGSQLDISQVMNGQKIFP